MGADGLEEDGDEDEEGNSAEHRAARSSDAGSRPPIYNAEGMHEKLEDICWPSEVPDPSASVYYLVKCKGPKDFLFMIPITAAEVHRSKKIDATSF